MPKLLMEMRNLNKSYGTEHVLQDVSFFISEQERIGLIGVNGAGKSTLLRILTREEELDSGSMHLHKDTRLGIVRQHEILPEHGTVMEYLESRSGKPTWQIARMSARFGLGGEFLLQIPHSLSGGYQMRVKLIGMLLQDPNLLILDEPVNYLDLDTLLLLEQFLRFYKGAYVIAAHDRTFLQNTCTTTYEIESGTLTQFNGPVQEYLSYKEEQEAFARRTNKKLSRQIAHHQTFVDRFRYKASLASRAQNKLKHIARLKQNIAKIPTDLASAKINIASPPKSTGTALRVLNMSIGYSDYTVVSNIELEIMRGQHVAIAGQNGQGKSTFLKTIAGRIPELAGFCKWWHRAQIAYYGQHTEAELKPEETVQQYLMRCAPENTSPERILMMAGDFLFTTNDLDKKTQVLSGGQRARLCLAGMLLGEHNVLLLDEPTNHLDVQTVDRLAAALKAYTGTIIMVSHARTFVDAIADRVYEVVHGTVRQYMGTYNEYVEDLANRTVHEAMEDSVDKHANKQGGRTYMQVKEHQRAQERIEKKLKKLNAEKSEIMMFFFENPTDYAPTKATRLEEIGSEIESLESSWLSHEESIESLRDY